MCSRESLSRRCVLVKKVPEGLNYQCIYNIRGVEKFQRHYETRNGNGGERLIVLFRSQEDAENSLKEGHVAIDSDGRKLDLPVKSCPNRIIPVEWIDKSTEPDLSFINTMEVCVSAISIGLKEEDGNKNSKVKKEKVEEKAEDIESQDIYIPKFVIPPITSHKSTVTQVTEFPSGKNPREELKDLDIGNRKCRELNVEVRQGDITQEKTDAIVSCISESLDFNVGAVSKAVLRAAGDRIVKECRRKAQSFSSEEYVVTSGGNMDCKYIIHVKGQRSAEGWERMVTKALAHADKTGCRSISFPALGTGVVDIDPAEISLCMFRAISKYHPLNLQTVRVIVFQSQMLPVFEFTLESLSYVPIENTRDDFTGETRGHSNSKKSSSDYDKTLNNECEREDIDVSKYILRDNQIDEIKRLAKDTKIIVKEGKIELMGLVANVHEASKAIYKYLHQIKDKESAQTVQKYVEWQYEALADKWTKFEDDINLQIENAHQAGEDSCIVKDKKGIEYVIDFKKMEKHEKNKSWKKYKIKRADKGFPVGLPTSWVSMKNNQTVVEITLNHWDNEYQEVMSKFKATSKREVSISEIRRVQNPYLYQQYAAKRKEIEVKNGKDPQQWLWHGTYPDTVDKVINNGFNRRYCGRNGTKYGAGVYFAVRASYSSGYCRLDSNGLKHMFFVQVATGDHCMGNSSMNVLPPKPGAGSHVTYDSACDNLSNPEMYVIFHDSQAYPAYHIIFK